MRHILITLNKKLHVVFKLKLYLTQNLFLKYHKLQQVCENAVICVLTCIEDYSDFFFLKKQL